MRRLAVLATTLCLGMLAALPVVAVETNATYINASTSQTIDATDGTLDVNDAGWFNTFWRVDSVVAETNFAATATHDSPLINQELTDEDHDTMVEKDSLTVTAVLPPTAMPDSHSGDPSTLTPRAQPAEMIAVAFFAESSSYGGNLLPAIGLGIVIAVVSLLGVDTRKRD